MFICKKQLVGKVNTDNERFCVRVKKFNRIATKDFVFKVKGQKIFVYFYVAYYAVVRGGNCGRGCRC